jgi:hypothetical protein
MKINFQYDTDNDHKWPSSEEMDKVLDVMRKEKFELMSVNLAMTPQNCQMVEDIVKIVVVTLFQYDPKFFYLLALTKPLKLSAFYSPCFFIRELSKELRNDLINHGEFHSRARTASSISYNKNTLNAHIKERFRLYGIKFESEKETPKKAKADRKAA